MPKHAQTRIAVTKIRNCKFAPLKILPGKGADHANAGKIFLNNTGQSTFCLVNRLEDMLYLSEVKIAVDNEWSDQRKSHEGHRNAKREQQRHRDRGEQDCVANFHHLDREK